MPVLTASKPTAIEQGYLDQGYVLPQGWTWDRVATLRSLYEIEAILVPITRAGTDLPAAWGVPYIGGKPLTSRAEAAEVAAIWSEGETPIIRDQLADALWALAQQHGAG